MRNERLRALLLERGETLDKLAEAVHVDAKTVERWVTKGRVPYRKHRYDVAAFFGVDESYIWPDAMGADEVAAVSQSEIVTVYPHRWSVPRETMGHFFGKAEREIGVLVYSGMFVAEDMGMQRLFAERARAGARVRILLGDPDSPNVAERGATEGIGEGMAAKVRSSLVLFRPLLAEPGVEVRLHGTVLYNSIYRADDQLLVNTHLYGVMANNAPVFHLRKIPGGEMASNYLESFERVWEGATPYAGPAS
jgi:transcriptional regulator with XRE-family HTH domain